MVLGIFIACLVSIVVLGKIQLDKDIEAIARATAKLDKTVEDLKKLNKMLGL